MTQERDTQSENVTTAVKLKHCTNQWPFVEKYFLSFSFSELTINASELVNK